MEANLNFTSDRQKSYIGNTLKMSGSWRTAHTSISGSYPNRQDFYLPTFQLKNHLDIILRSGRNVYGITSDIQSLNRPQSLKIRMDVGSMEEA